MFVTFLVVVFLLFFCFLFFFNLTFSRKSFRKTVTVPNSLDSAKDGGFVRSDFIIGVKTVC